MENKAKRNSSFWKKNLQIELNSQWLTLVYYYNGDKTKIASFFYIKFINLTQVK